MPIQAVIFDMDGVITDSEPFYGEAVNAALNGTGHRLTAEDHSAIMGSSIDYTWEWVIERFKLKGPAEQWQAKYFREVVHILEEKAEPMPGIYALLDGLCARELKLGLATSSQRAWADAILGKLGVAERFQAIATRDMVRDAKPAPDLYLLAARGLGIRPSACLAVEDSPRGIQAARRAGMPVVALRTASTAGLDISGADFLLDGLDQFDYAWLSTCGA